jgi:drug/metabolite transporter (DMT)-like permease
LIVAVILAFLSACGFASGSVLMRVGTQYVPPPAATFFTVLVGAVLITAIAFAVNFDEIKTLPLEVYGWVTAMGILAYCVARVLHNWALRMVGATRAVPMISLQPLMAFAIGFLILGERPNLLVTIGTPIVVGGILLVVMPRRSAGETNRVEVRKLGYLLAIGGSMAFVTRDAISRHVLGALALAPPFVVSGFALVFGGAILFAFIHRSVINSIRNLPLKYVGICCLAGLLQGLAVASLFHALSRAPVTVVTPIYASQPIIALVLASVFLRQLESVDWLLAVGTLLSVGGVILVILGATM